MRLLVVYEILIVCAVFQFLFLCDSYDDHDSVDLCSLSDLLRYDLIGLLFFDSSKGILAR